jgi:hypothetical protein
MHLKQDVHTFEFISIQYFEFISLILRRRILLAVAFCGYADLGDLMGVVLDGDLPPPLPPD